MEVGKKTLLYDVDVSDIWRDMFGFMYDVFFFADFLVERLWRIFSNGMCEDLFFLCLMFSFFDLGVKRFLAKSILQYVVYDVFMDDLFFVYF